MIIYGITIDIGSLIVGAGLASIFFIVLYIIKQLFRKKVSLTEMKLVVKQADDGLHDIHNNLNRLYKILNEAEQNGA